MSGRKTITSGEGRAGIDMRWMVLVLINFLEDEEELKKGKEVHKKTGQEPDLQGSHRVGDWSRRSGKN